MPPPGGGAVAGSPGTSAEVQKGDKKSVVFAPSPVPWVAKPVVPAGETIPAGLEYLLKYDEALFVPLEDKQGFEEIDKLTLKNTYDIRTRDGKRLYLAVLCERPGLVFRRQWAFRLSFYDRSKRRVIIFNRASTLHCFSCIETCRTQMMRGKVGSPIGEVGSIVGKCHWLSKPSFSLIDSLNNVLFRVKPPSKADKGVFHILDKKTKKQEGSMGVLAENPSWSREQHAFRVEFPKNSPCHVKVLLIGAAMLLNVLFWETEDRGPPPELSTASFDEHIADMLDEEISELQAEIVRDTETQMVPGQPSQRNSKQNLHHRQKTQRGSATRFWDRLLPKLGVSYATTQALTTVHPSVLQDVTTPFLRSPPGLDVIGVMLDSPQHESNLQHSSTSLPCLKALRSKSSSTTHEDDDNQDGFVKQI